MTKDGLTFLVFVTFSIVYLIVKYFDLNITFWNKSGSEPGPIISSAGLLSSGNLASLHKGLIEGFEYNLIAGASGRVVVFVQLPNKTGVQLVAIGAKSKLDKILSHRSIRKTLTKLDLEGDFPDYFDMYCSKGHEQELLQVFDPADMAYFADFCQAYDFELYEDTIYISQAENATDKQDTTSLIKDIEVFIKKNKALLQNLQA